MHERATDGYSRNIIIALGISLALLLPGRTAFAQDKPNPTATPTCLVKYTTLSDIVCSSTTPESVALPLANLEEEKNEAISPQPTKKEESPIREMKGIKSQYLYTDRVTKDKEGWYTKMRSKPDEDSKRLETLRPGDKIRILKDDKKGWYYVQIFKSHNPKLEGKNGWLETWLVDDENVPVEPTETPTPTIAPKQEESVKGASDNKNTTLSGAVSGEADTLFNMINDFRSGNGLPKFEKSERLCEIARSRAPEVAGEVASGTVHAGFHSRGLGYPVAVENEVGYGNIQANFNFWINSSLHRGSILGADLKYSCLECTNGNCVQEFSPNP